MSYHSNNIYYDFETTGLDVLKAEIITGYFYIDENNFYDFKVRPECWSIDAEKVHGIKRGEALTFPTKKEAYPRLLKWMRQNKGSYWCFANENNFGSKYQYDNAILKSEMFRLELETAKRWYYGFLEVFENSGDYEFKSIHTLAKLKLRGHLKKYDLKTLCNFFKIEIKDHHNSKWDAMVLKQLHLKLRDII